MLLLIDFGNFLGLTDLFKWAMLIDVYQHNFSKKSKKIANTIIP